MSLATDEPDGGGGPVPLCSWLYVPAHDERKLDRAERSGADVVILDLEDGTPPASKAEARERSAERLRHGSFGTAKRVVRIQAPEAGTDWRADVLATIGGRPDAYLLPKVEDPGSITAVADLAAAEAPDGGPPDLVVLAETPRAVARALDLADHPAVAGLAWGAEDLSADLAASPVLGPDGDFEPIFDHARCQVLLAARAARRVAVDTPHVDHRDAAAVARQATAAARMGFTGVQAIHPDQVPIIHEAFRPSDEEVERAHRIVAILGPAGGGAATLDGKMIDTPHLRAARRTLARVR